MFFKKKNDTDGIIVHSPISGKVKPLSKVNDQVFSGEMMGPGLAVVPTNGKVLSPVKGLVKVAFPTRHAFGIEIKGTDKELLVHIGVDTVDLNGEGFNKKIEQGKKVDVGTEICEFDLDLVSKKAKSADVIIVALQESLGDYKLEVIAQNEVKVGEPLFKLVKK